MSSGVHEERGRFPVVRDSLAAAGGLPFPPRDTCQNPTMGSHKVSDTVMATRMKRRRRDDRSAQRGPRRAVRGIMA